MSTELENFASTLADRIELELEGEARANFEQLQEREALRRAAQAAQGPAVSTPTPAPIAPTPVTPTESSTQPTALPGWEDAQ